MKKRNLNSKQIENLRALIRSYLHQKMDDASKVGLILEKLKKYGVKTGREAIQLYKENRHMLQS